MPPRVASPTPPATPVAPADMTALRGAIRLPSRVLANNGARLVTSAGGQVISDQGASVLSNNGGNLITDNGAGIIGQNGANLITDNGAGIIGQNGANAAAGGGRYQLRQAAAGPGGAAAAIANAQVGLFDAAGRPLRDAMGAPLVTTTDATGRYAFPAVPQGRYAVVVCQLAGAAGQAAALAPPGAGEVDVDLASSLVTSYVLTRYAATTPDPQAALERLPADLASEVKKATARSLTEADLPDRLVAAAATQALDGMRGRLAQLDGLYEEVRRVMVVAGQADLGEGASALTTRLGMIGPVRRDADGELLLWEMGVGRLWAVVDGRLRKRLGGGGRAAAPPAPGTPAADAPLGGLYKAIRRDAQGRTLLLGAFRLDRVRADGTLEHVWAEPREFAKHSPDTPPEDREALWLTVDAFPLAGDQLLVVRTDRVVSVGGAPAYPFSPPTEADPFKIAAAHLAADGTLWLTTERIPFLSGEEFAEGPGAAKTLWRLRPGQPAEAQPAIDDPYWLGFDGAGALVTVDTSGAFRFHGRDGRVETIPPATTAGWPGWMRPPRPEDGRYWPGLRWGGDAATGRWASDYQRLATLGPDGRATVLVAGAGEAPASEEATPLRRPVDAVEAADGALLVLDDGRRQVLRVVGQRASVAAGRTPPEGLAGAGLTTVPGQPHGYVWGFGEHRVADFGEGYARPAAEALFAWPSVLRLAADGAFWVLDVDGLLRRVQDGALATVAAKPMEDEARWVDFRPLGAGRAEVLAHEFDLGERQDVLRLLAVEGTRPPVELAELPAAPADEDDLLTDCGAPLPDGGWLLRARGELWRWRPGGAPVKVGPNGVAGPDRRASLAIDPKGRVALCTGNVVYRVDPATAATTAVAGKGTGLLGGATPDTGIMGASRITATAGGDLLVADTAARQVKRIPADAW